VSMTETTVLTFGYKRLMLPRATINQTVQHRQMKSKSPIGIGSIRCGITRVQWSSADNRKKDSSEIIADSAGLLSV